MIEYTQYTTKLPFNIHKVSPLFRFKSPGYDKDKINNEIIRLTKKTNLRMRIILGEGDINQLELRLHDDAFYIRKRTHLEDNSPYCALFRYKIHGHYLLVINMLFLRHSEVTNFISDYINPDATQDESNFITLPIFSDFATGGSAKNNLLSLGFTELDSYYKHLHTFQALQISVFNRMQNTIGIPFYSTHYYIPEYFQRIKQLKTREYSNI